MLSSGDRVWCTFTIYNVLALIFGILVTAGAGWLIAAKGSLFFIAQLEELGRDYDGGTSALDQGGYVLLGVGVAIVVQSVVGCLGAGLGCSGRGRYCLLAYGLLLSLVVVLEIVAVILVLAVYAVEVDTEAREFLQRTLQDYPEHGNGVAVVWDSMMTGLGCCGVNNYTDFAGLLPATHVVPEACCLRVGGEVVDASCTSAPTSATAYLGGCYALLAPSAVPALTLSLVVVTIFQVAGVVLSCCLARHMDQKREWYEMTSL